jgi:ABC-2 type transport system permease protein
VLTLVLGMHVLLALLTPAALHVAGLLNPVAAPQGAMQFPGYLGLLGRIFLSAFLLVGLQLWIALRYTSFVPALATGIGGTFFAVVATSAKVGALLPWQIPVNQLASDPARADLALVLGCLGGGLVFWGMLWQLGRREVS